MEKSWIIGEKIMSWKLKIKNHMRNDKERLFFFRLIINDNLDCGTQLPFIKKAVDDGFGVMVLNTNLNYVTQEGEEVPVRVRIGCVTISALFLA